MKFRNGSGGGCFVRFLSTKPGLNSTFVVSEQNLFLTDDKSALCDECRCNPDATGDCNEWSVLTLVLCDIRLELAASLSVDFFLPPRLNDDNDRGKRERNAGVNDDWTVGELDDCVVVDDNKFGDAIGLKCKSVGS